MIHVGGGGGGGEGRGYHKYIGGCSAHWRDTIMHVGDIMIHNEYIRVFKINERLLSISSLT